jgi:hypothetical protein
MLKAQFNEEMIANIDAGIYRHASIGFHASDLVAGFPILLENPYQFRVLSF